MRIRAVLLACLLVATVAGAVPASAAEQNDAGSGADAGDTFAAATAVLPRGAYAGGLDRTGGDVDDFFKFHLDEGASTSVLIDTDAAQTDPVELLDPNGVPVDTGTFVLNGGWSPSAALTATSTRMRLAVHKALLAGDYRLHLQAKQFDLRGYTLCFVNCEGFRDDPIQFVFGGALRSPITKVLLVPPSHGDLGNPAGPTVFDYTEATRRGMGKWKDALWAFAADNPQYAYLRQIDIRIDISDDLMPVQPAGFDVIIGYVAAGPAFRGVASEYDDGATIRSLLTQWGLDDAVHYHGRVIALSLFGSSPRAGQILYDFPALDDLEIVTSHEFGHTFGLGHTTTWDPALGPDVMNSPAPFVYGDGFPIGDGGERTGMKCLSSLDLYGMAVLYRWVPSGAWEPTYAPTRLPREIPYRWYC